MARPILLGALFASLALNVFIGGAFVGAQLEKAKAPPGERMMAAAAQRNPLVAAVRALPPEHRQAWRDQNPAFAATYGPKTREARRLAREAMLGLGAEPFDPQTSMADLERARALEHEVRVAMDRRVVTFAGTLPHDERAAFGQALARPRLGRGGGPGDPGGQALPDR
ncbi:periplasmic heavy metal sensor [Phenylobacterium sp.]|uniref:periplasmic heavy metal sensor n=1 Tax=Phenylobacterium sp. TaxID=1871053 RepID=UPI0025D1E7CE|nr:periplasmic heavy metal sensor [Phenylobacterium sp.]